VSDSFFYLTIRNGEGVPSAWFPLLFVGTSSTYLLLALPFGQLADRFGRRRVFLAGHVLLLSAYVLLLSPLPGLVVTLGSVGLLGCYYAATDGVLSALTVPLVQDSVRSTGLALVQTSVAVAKLFSAVLFGLVWSASGQHAALVVFTVALAAALPLAMRMLPSPRPAR
jgi:MFS family permease